jgi:hypothetical protein
MKTPISKFRILVPNAIAHNGSDAKVLAAIAAIPGGSIRQTAARAKLSITATVFCARRLASRGVIQLC